MNTLCPYIPVIDDLIVYLKDCLTQVSFIMVHSVLNVTSGSSLHPGLRGELLYAHIFCREQSFGLSDHFLPALTCCHSENKRCYQSNSQTIHSKTSLPTNRKRPERPGKVPTTPVTTHLGAQQNSWAPRCPQTFTSQHCTKYNFFVPQQHCLDKSLCFSRSAAYIIEDRPCRGNAESLFY